MSAPRLIPCLRYSLQCTTFTMIVTTLIQISVADEKPHSPLSGIHHNSLSETTGGGEGLPAVRSPVESSQQATEFLVNNWNDLTTWYPGNRSLSECEKHVEQTIKGYLANDMWAMQVFDAWAKPGPSLLEGRSIFVGNYHQCRGVRSPPGKTGERFGGNYCVIYLTNLTVPKEKNDFFTTSAQQKVKVGVCLPDSCTLKDVTDLFKERLHLMNLSSFLESNSTDCLSDEREVTTFTKIALLIVLAIGTLVILGTAIDLAAQFGVMGSRKLSSKGQAKEPEIITHTTEGFLKPMSPHLTLDRKADEPKLETDVKTTEKYRTPLSRDQTAEDQATEPDPETSPQTTEESRKPMPPNLATESQTKEREQEDNTETTGVWVNVLLSFSAYTNGKRLLSTSQAPGSITVIHGLRFLTMAWIIIGHTYFVLLLGRASNTVQGNASFLRSRISDIVLSMPLGVDTFFVISGFLVSYLNLKKVTEKGCKFSWLRYFLHRYWRLTPTYIVALVLVVGLQRFFVSGPMAPTVQPYDKEVCEKYWWAFLFYINNLTPAGACFVHCWSMAADYQFHLLSPLMIIPFYYHRYGGIASCLFFTFGQMTLSGILAYNFEMKIGTLEQPPIYLFFTYISFYARIGPFALGVLTGYIMSSNNCRVPMDKYVVVIGWILSTIAGLAVVFGVHGDLSGTNPSSLLVATLYNATCRTVFGACICWVIVACTSGYGGPIHTFLSWPPFTVLSRLTYSGYLVSLSVLAVTLENLEQPIYFNMFSLVVLSVFGVVFTSTAAAILVVCVEMPTLSLEKVRDPIKKL